MGLFLSDFGTRNVSAQLNTKENVKAPGCSIEAQFGVFGILDSLRNTGYFYGKLMGHLEQISRDIL